MKIIKNQIKCLRCGEVIVSETRYDYRTCSCGSCSVDGGKEYLRRCGNKENWQELSEIKK